MSQLYTSSRLRVLRECLRKHFYKYQLRILTPSTESMLFGTVGHRALEAYFIAWRKGQLESRLDCALQAIHGSELSPHDRIRLSALIIAYHVRWGDEPWDVLAVEVEFQYTLGDYLIGGKIDALIRDTRDGRVYVLEHKTTGQDASPGSAYWERLTIDTQVSVYVDGATMLGYEIAGCVYDVLQRPRHELKLATPEAEREYTTGRGCKKCGGSAKAGEIQQGKGFYAVAFASEVKQVNCPDCNGTGWKCNKDGVPEAPRLYAKQRATDESFDEFEARIVGEIAERPEDFLIRGVVVRLEDELPKMRTDLLDTIRMERMAAVLFQDAPPRNPDACAKFGSLCDFFDACAGRASIDDLIRFPRGDSAHPELSAAA